MTPVETSISKSQIDRLGNRLRNGGINENDVRLLDEYRRSFNDAYEIVVGSIRQKLGLEPTGRPAKSTISITEKLQRESIRLSQIQDIAGCRLIVPAIAEQERIVASILEIVPNSIVVDRRQKPSHGYRAVHVVVSVEQRSVEIQVRTALQQVWAELSEKLADLIDPAIKYGGGEEYLREFLSTASAGIAVHENNESKVLEMQRDTVRMLAIAGLTDELRANIISLEAKLATLQADLGAHREKGLSIFGEAVQFFEKLRNK